MTRRLAVLVLAACGSSARAPLSHRAQDPEPTPRPMLGDAGLRGHEDGRVPTKAALEALLPGSIAHVQEDVILVELAGVPAPKLLDKSIDGDVAMLIFDRGATIDVFAVQVTMPHGLRVGMTLDEARRRQPKIACETYDPRIGPDPGLSPPPYLLEVCTLPSSPRFRFHMHDDRIDYISFSRN